MPSRIEDQERLLEEMLSIQADIRKQNERKRILKSNDDELYSKMFKPVTRSIQKLVAPPISSLHSQPPPLPPAVKEPAVNDDDDDDDKEMKVEDEEKEIPPGDLYYKALEKVPRKFRDDGKLGLNTLHRKIGGFDYEVHGNVLKIFDDDDSEEIHKYDIDDENLWMMLLAKNPQTVKLAFKDKEGKYLPFAEKYREIAKDLNLTDAITRGLTKRTKYKIINKKGSGFMFTCHPPLVNPNTVVIPSDNDGLMHALVVALAELRAGNNSMRNILVPLAQEAQRKRILPKDLPTPNETTWVFA